MSLELSPRQAKTVGAAITALAAAVIVLVTLGLFVLLARFVSLFSSVFLPLFIAGMILAIPLTTFLVVFWRLAKAKYITELV